MDCLPPFRDSLNSLGHRLLTKNKPKRVTKEDTYKEYIQVTWIAPPCKLSSKMAFYVEHFFELMDNLIIRPPYRDRRWMHL